MIKIEINKLNIFVNIQGIIIINWFSYNIWFNEIEFYDNIYNVDWETWFPLKIYFNKKNVLRFYKIFSIQRIESHKLENELQK
jgi:hypothetical protein